MVESPLGFQCVSCNLSLSSDELVEGACPTCGSKGAVVRDDFRLTPRNVAYGMRMDVSFVGHGVAVLVGVGFILVGFGALSQVWTERFSDPVAAVFAGTLAMASGVGAIAWAVWRWRAARRRAAKSARPGTGPSAE